MTLALDAAAVGLRVGTLPRLWIDWWPVVVARGRRHGRTHTRDAGPVIAVGTANDRKQIALGAAVPCPCQATSMFLASCAALTSTRSRKRSSDAALRFAVARAVSEVCRRAAEVDFSLIVSVYQLAQGGDKGCVPRHP